MLWCGGATGMDSGAHGMKASIIISFAGIRQTYTTRNRHDRPGLITLELVDGPFSMLTGKWEFQELAPDASKVLFTMEYAFSSRALEAVVGPVRSEEHTSELQSLMRNSYA